MPGFKCLLSGLLALLVLPLSSLAGEGRSPALAITADGFAVAESCARCHLAERQAWQDSDHAWAMREASPANVLGNFKDVQFRDGEVRARFFRRGERFFVNTEGEDGHAADFAVAYTFGVRPLQQYLVEFPGGRLQSLTIAWDSRPHAEGGQRWFSLYPGQRFMPGDALHWTGRYQNWNAMCADCHSTNLRKNYDAGRDTFASTWHEQTVGCQSCHGPAQAHVDWAEQHPRGPSEAYASLADIGLAVDFKALGSRGQVEQCARCHSRRQTLEVGPRHGQPLLDSMLPATLRTELYHADGQIQGEVYVYGSFTQSKMYAAGVACSDCHDPHSARLKIDGNGLCLQCHNPTPPSTRFASLKAKDYASPAHHHHPEGSAGAQCVACHMPAKTYMQVDPRRDHSLRIPRPDLADKTASPDACTGCHREQTPAWAARTIAGWFPASSRPAHFGEVLQVARSGQGDSLALLAGLIADLTQPAIARATAANHLAELGEPALPSLRQALQDPEALVRAHAIPAFAELTPVERGRLLLPLLDDPQQAVRDEALRALASIPLIALPAERRAGYQAAQQDYERRLRGNADLPGNRLNLAVLLERSGRQVEALQEYRQALELDPHFAPARVNLATLANETLRPDEAEQVLRDGVALTGGVASDRSQLAFLLALLLAERGAPDEALQWLDMAAKGQPQNARIGYNQGLLLWQLGRTDEARLALERGLALADEDAELLYALAYLYGSTGERQKAHLYLQRLERLQPADPRVRQLKQQLFSRP